MDWKNRTGDSPIFFICASAKTNLTEKDILSVWKQAPSFFMHRRFRS